MTRREMLEAAGKVAALTVVATPVMSALGDAFTVSAQAQPLNAIAGIDRVVMKTGRTYLNGWAGYGAPPRPGRQGGGGGRGAAAAPTPPPEPPGPAPKTTWSKLSGPGAVTFADPNAAVTTATFAETGDYVLKVTADNGTTKAESTLAVKVELPPPPVQLAPVVTTRHTITSPMWKSRTKALITTWIPHCVAQIERTDLIQGTNTGSGGIDNFVEAAKALRGEPHTAHKGYVFSNAWVHQTVESISLALMVDPEGDKDIIAAQARLKATLDDWIPKILAAQHPDGYLQTAYTLRGAPPVPPNPAGAWRDGVERWTPQARGNHEGYTAGYFIESAINHYSMTNRQDARLYNAAKKLADCWVAHLGPAPKQEWFDGHQEMEQALVRFGRYVNEVEMPGRKGLRRSLHRAREVPARQSQGWHRVRPEPRAGAAAVRSRRPRRARGLHLLGHGGRRRRDARRGLSERREVPLGQHRPPQVLPDGRRRQRREFGGLRAELLASQQRVLRNVLELRRSVLPVEAAPRVSRREVRRPVRADAVQRALRRLDLAGTTFYYTNPLDQNSQRTTWHSCPCCVGNLARTMLMLPTWTYSKGGDGIYVNLFVGSRVMVPGVAGTDVEMVQTTDYPWAGKVTIGVNPAAAKAFSVRIRVPDRDVSSLYSSKPAANGLVVAGRERRGGQADCREWLRGDRPHLEEGRHDHARTADGCATRLRQREDRDDGPGRGPDGAADAVLPNKDKVALRYGPLVYNIEQIDQDITQALPPAATLSTEWRGDLLGGVTVIKGTFANGAPMTAIPNFARYNRNPPAPPPPAPTPRPSPDVQRRRPSLAPPRPPSRPRRGPRRCRRSRSCGLENAKGGHGRDAGPGLEV